MKAIKFIPRKTPYGWQVNIPASLSESGIRQRLYFKSKDEAEKHAIPLRKGKRDGGLEKLIPQAQSRFASRALELLEGRPPEELLEAVSDWLKKQDHAARSVTFSQACDDFRASKEKMLTSKYLWNFENYPKRFPAIANKLMAEISGADLEKLLGGLSPQARRTAEAHLSSLWSFSIRRKWAVVNPFEEFDPVAIPRPKIHILSAPEIRALFDSTIRLHADLVPLVVVQAFAGVRPAESEKLTWENIDFEDGILSIPDEVAKTRIGRHIEMHKTLVDWLNWHISTGGSNKGKILPDMPKRTKSNPRKGKFAPAADPEEYSAQVLRQRVRKIREDAGLNPWPQDGLRHTFASASLASGWRDIGSLCMELGHSSQKMLHRHYARSMRRKDGEAVFQVGPPALLKKSKVVSIHAAA